MKILGLGSDLYYINNQIWIDLIEIQQSAKWINISLSNINDPSQTVVAIKPLRLYNFGSTVEYDLSDVIKGNFTEPHYPANILNDEPIGTNYVRFQITFTEILINNTAGASITIIKTFLRGGFAAQTSNINSGIMSILQYNGKIPRWGFYPVRKFWINADKKIVSTNIIPDSETIDMPVIGCLPLYLRFLNEFGGYSYWMFETESKIQKTKTYDIIESRTGSYHLGVEVDYGLEGESRIRREFFPLIKGLMKSPEIYAYNQYFKEWANVSIADHTFTENNFEDLQKVSIRLNVKTTEKPAVIW